MGIEVEVRFSISLGRVLALFLLKPFLIILTLVKLSLCLGIPSDRCSYIAHFLSIFDHMLDS